MDKLVNRNFPWLLHIINKNAKIVKIFESATEEEPRPQPFFEKGYKIVTIPKNYSLYKGYHWFYPADHDPKEAVTTFSDIRTAASNACIMSGGVNAYKTTKELKLLVLDYKDNVKKIIQKFFEPYTSGSKKTDNLEFFKYMKQAINLDTKNNLAVTNILAFITKSLGFHGTFTTNTVTINDTKELIERNIKDSYDWTNWGIDNDFLLPFSEFKINKNLWKLNDEFRIYRFYKKMSLPNVKSVKKYDFATLPVNNFVSINEYFTTDICIKKTVSLIEKFGIAFICLQEIEKNNLETLEKVIKEEKLHTSVTDFERDSKDIKKYNIVISKKPLTIVDKEILPGNSEYSLIFKHPDFKNKTFLTTDTATTTTDLKLQQMIKIKDRNPDIILASTHISIQNTIEFKALSGFMYALNNSDINYTNYLQNQSEYIMTKLPLILQACDAINYKYSLNRILLGKIDSIIS